MPLTLMDNFINIEIRKPIYANYIAIRDKYLLEAKRTKKLLRITIPAGTAIVSYATWMKDAKLIEKEFKIPGHPMKLWANFLQVRKTCPQCETETDKKTCPICHYEIN